jgi:2-isopropylmalate synthase
MVGHGDGAISAFVDALGIEARVMDYQEHAIGTGTDTRAASYVEMSIGDAASALGVGIHVDIVTSSFLAILSAVNRQAAAGVAMAPKAMAA